MVLFVSESGSITQLFLPVAKALASLAPAVECQLLDVSKLGASENEFIEADNRLFLDNGFPVEDLGPYDEASHLSRRQQYVLRLSEAVCRLQPAVVVVPHEYGWAFDAVKVAKKYGVPTYHLQHGLWGQHKFGVNRTLDLVRLRDATVSRIHGVGSIIHRQKDILTSEMYLMRELAAGVVRRLKRLGNRRKSQPSLWETPMPNMPFEAGTTRKGICGPYYLRLFVAMGVDPATIDIVGYTRTDNFLASKPKSYEALCREYDLDAQVDELALYFWAPFEQYPDNYVLKYDQRQAFLETVSIIRELRPKMNILLLAHPRDSVESHEHWLRSVDLSFVRVGRAGMNHYSLYMHSTLVIGAQSTCLAEAMLCRRPVAKLGYLLYEDREPKLLEGAAVIPVLSHLHLREQLDRALNDKPYVERIVANQAHVAFDLMYHFDGKCGERVARSILHLIEVKDV